MSVTPVDRFDAGDPPAGALRILARRGDAEILIVHGEDRQADLDAGERLARVTWLPSIEVAATVARFCCRQLSTTFPPDGAGWRPFALEHVDTLLALARTHLNVTYFAPEPKPERRGDGAARVERQAWTRDRLIRFVQLVTLGHTAKGIAADPQIRTTENNVYQRAHEFGLSLASRPHGQVILRLPADVLAFYDAAGVREGLSRDAMMARHLIAGARCAAPAALAG